MIRNKLFIIFFFLTISLKIFAQLQEEVLQILYPLHLNDSVVLINPEESFEQEIIFAEKEYPVQRYLRVAGGIKMPEPFVRRGETLFREAEFLIDDLDSINVSKDKYSLYFSGNNEPFEQHVYNRISVPDLKSGNLAIETKVQRNTLQVDQTGDFGIELQLYFKKENRHPHEIYDLADSVIFLPFPAGSGKFQTLKYNVSLPKNIATILLRIGGSRFSGECWVESPRLIQDKKQIVSMPFVPHEKRTDNYNYWVGINLASRSWPRWKLEFNGQTLFEGNIFDRASDIADFYIKMPELSGQGKLKLSLLKEKNKASFPYELHKLQLIEESARDFEIVSIPRYISVGDTAGILLEINKPGISLEVSSNESVGILQNEYTFETVGLHVVGITALSSGINLPVTFSGIDDTRKINIKQIVSKEKDDVRLSSGDEIYIDKAYNQYDYFFKWYFRHRIGNFYQFRPSYQWSGFRIADENVISHYTDLLNKLHIPYAWQVEGRTLAGSSINPSLETLKSSMFRGKQAHENDGGYYYWQHFQYEGLHSDMAARTRPYGGIFAKHPPIYTGDGIFIHYNPYKVTDMADGARYFVENLTYSRGESTRHTGPSVMFRYLYQAGYEWLGAEQMYGPENTVMSALRGASRAYGKKEFGSLHAVQWGSQPFTDPKHSLRFYLSLAVAYMHGSSHINTEEGLWTDEYANDRFTEAGKEHLYAQHRMLDFIETHSRRGEFYTKIAVLQGRNDAWKSFGRTSAWSQNGEKWQFNKAMESFDLLNVFYPKNNLNISGPDGWFTDTPYGPIDILPIEAGINTLSSYDILIFLGWNTFDENDFKRLTQFVANGGKLLLTAAHINAELQPDKPTKFPENDSIIKTLLGSDYQNYKEKTEIIYGNGKVIYFPQKSYPVEEDIRNEYEKTMHRLADEIIAKESAEAWIAGSPYIDFTVWDSAGRRTFYVLNVDWESEEISNPANLLLNNKNFTFDVPRYSMTAIHCAKGIAVLPLGNTSDVLEINENNEEWFITIQTAESDMIYLFNGITEKKESIFISAPGIHNISVRK